MVFEEQRRAQVPPTLTLSHTHTHTLSDPIQSPSPFLRANLRTVQISNTSIPLTLIRFCLANCASLPLLLSLLTPPPLFFFSPSLSLFIYRHPSCLETAGLCLETRSSRWPRKPSLAWRPWNTCEYPTMLGCPLLLPGIERESVEDGGGGGEGVLPKVAGRERAASNLIASL